MGVVLTMSRNNFLGKIEYSDNKIVKGWALSRSRPDEPLNISVFDGDIEIEKLSPSLYRWDLKQEGYGRGYHGFVCYSGLTRARKPGEPYYHRAVAVKAPAVFFCDLVIVGYNESFHYFLPIIKLFLGFSTRSGP